MFAAFGGGYAIDKRNLSEFVGGREDNGIFPAIIRRFVYFGGLGGLECGILTELLYRDGCGVECNADFIVGNGGNVASAFFKQLNHIRR